MKANSASLPSSNFLRAGFSLVEVVLAVGIMALGVVTILGLLPHGLEMSRKTANEQAETRIVDQIVGELQASEWTTLGGVTGPGNVGGIVLQYDDQGLRTLEGALTTYVARVMMVDDNESTTGMEVPSNGGGAAFNPNLRRVRIDVAAAQNADFDFDNPPPAAPVKRFTSLVAKMRP
jgi:uncharacterized protein (TIGR02598 family)